MAETIEVTAPGEVVIDDITLIASIKGRTVEIILTRTFAELSLFEDLFSNSLYGNILISDSHNMLDQLSIQGLEGLRLKFHTPGLSDNQTIYKTFGIYAISDQQVIQNDRLQTYRLHFASLEFLNDIMARPLNRSMPTAADGIEEKAHDIVPFVFNKYVTKAAGSHIPRNLYTDDQGKVEKSGPSDLVLGFAPYDYYETLEKHSKYSNVYVDEAGSYQTSKKLRFIVPNWTPLKTISYATNRSVPNKVEHAGSFVFYESNKAFHYCSIDTLIASGKKAGATTFLYKYDPANIATDKKATGYTKNVAEDMMRVLNFEVQKNFNLLDNQNMGLFGAQVRTVDSVLKRYREHNYSSEADFEDHEHTAQTNKVGMFPHAPDKLFGNDKTRIDPRANTVYKYREPFFLFDKETEVPLITHPNWVAQRMARLSSISNFSLQILVNGRTDIKVGDCITFNYPGLRGSEENSAEDKFFNGVFLITAIHHAITPLKHVMTLEIIKEGLEEEPDPGTTAPSIPYEENA